MEGNPYWKPTPLQWTIWGIATAGLLVAVVTARIWVAQVTVLLMFVVAMVAMVARRKRKAAEKSLPPEPKKS
ncbi:MAG TPA: hypothetical protein VM452_02005 [Caulifigura sp.]|jgi:DMSO/TMAO reductase YedYZ heme-binding membrane subunit|nr:hypothetical protein [Caulifigura sp.]